MAPRLIGRDDELSMIRDVCVGRRHGVALIGSSGIGRTALADAAATIAAQLGVTSFRVRATPAAATMAFGALAHLLPARSNDSGFSVIKSFSKALAASSSDRGGLLIVDDAQDLDASSLAAVQAIAAARATRLMLTASTSDPLPTTLTRMWNDGLVDVRTIGPIASDDVGRLVERTVGAPVEGGSVRRLTRLSGGRPAYIVALADHATWNRDGDAYALVGDPATAEPVVRLVEPSLSSLDEPQRAALAMLDSTHPIDVLLISDAFGGDAADALEREGLASVDDTGGMTADAQLLAAVARIGLPSAMRRSAAAAIANAVEAAGGIECVDRRRRTDYVEWRLLAALSCDDDVLIHTSRDGLRNGEVEAARDIARVAVDRVDGSRRWEAAFVLAQAARLLGDNTESEWAFALAIEAPEPHQRVDVAIARAELIGVSQGRHTDAVAGLAEVAAGVLDDELVRRLESERALLSSLAGDFRDVVATVAPLQFDDADELSTLLTMNALVFAKTMLLHLDGLDETIDRMIQSARSISPTFPMLDDQLEVLGVTVLLAQGRVDDALRRCAEAQRRLRRGEPGAGLGTWCAMEALACSFRGSTRVGDLSGRAAASLRTRTPLGMQQLGSLLAATALAMSGRITPALEIVDRLEPPAGEIDRLTAAIMIPRITAWSDAAKGDRTAAADALVTVGRQSIESSHLYWGMFAIHDAVRLGAADRAVDLLDSIAGDSNVGCRWLDVARLHARAEIGADATALERVADEFSGFGAMLAAAEVDWRVGSLLEMRGRDAEAARARARAQLATDDRTPMMTGEPPLTERQTVVARLTVAGLASREIAGRLAISVRTVDNHLAAVYRRLEIGTRAELGALMARREVTPTS